MFQSETQEMLNILHICLWLDLQVSLTARSLRPGVSETSISSSPKKQEQRKKCTLFPVVEISRTVEYVMLAVKRIQNGG